MIKKLTRIRSAVDNAITPENWSNYFSELLNNEPDIDNEFEEHVTNVIIQHDDACEPCISIEPDALNRVIEIDETISVIKNLKNCKQPGIDGLSYEFFKHCGDTMIKYMCVIFNAILNTGVYPIQWCEAIISPLHKKGSKSDVKKYRGLSLLCSISKMFTKILSNSLTAWAELNGILDESQGAYRKGRLTVDHIFSLYAIVKKYIRKRGGRFCVAFIDFSRAFDSVPYSVLWYRLLQNGIHGKILTVFRSMYSQLKSCVKTLNGLTYFFLCTVVKVVPRYADDIYIINDTVGRLQNQLNVLGEFCSKYGLSVTLSK